MVILAAGKGSRLGALAADRPKWLLQVGGRPIADRQMQAVRSARQGGSKAVASVRVVTGHAAGAVEAYLDPEDHVQLVHNPQYAALNNWYSLLVALRSIDDPDPSVAVLNSDLFAPAQWILAFLEAAAECSHDALIAVDVERTLTHESMKVSRNGTSLAAIGKVDIEDPIGEYVGMLMARGDALRRFRAALEGFEDVDGHAQEWYERAVGLTAAAGVPWSVWATPGSGWVEIDDDADHAAAVQMARAGD